MPVTLELSHFDPYKIMESGQCFRMIALSPDTYEVIAQGKRLCINDLGNRRYRFDCSAVALAARWRVYFDLDRDYAALLDAAPKADAFLLRALADGYGLRILRQDPWETLCGFILSQRKHLKAIRASMEALCNPYGAPLAGTARKAFPTPERLAALCETDLRACGLGYRAPYVLDAARKVASGALDLAALAALPDDALLNRLMGVNGVGIKVAECVALFAYARLARAPVDVWIQRVIDQVYGGVSPFAGYGAYAGVYQQYMFMSMRNDGYSVHPQRIASQQRDSH